MSHAEPKEVDRRVGPLADVSVGRPRKNRHLPRVPLNKDILIFFKPSGRCSQYFGPDAGYWVD